jgi:hypothetical protein
MKHLHTCFFCSKYILSFSELVIEAFPYWNHRGHPQKDIFMSSVNVHIRTVRHYKHSFKSIYM